MMIKTLDRLNGEGLEILSEKARDCKSVEAIRCISSGSGAKTCRNHSGVKVILLFVLLICFGSCKKKYQTIPPCVAGNGGLIQVVLFANHGSTPMYNYLSHPDTAFVKYGTLSFTQLNKSNCDTFYVSDFSMRDHIHCTNLKCGNYYFVRTAYDSVTNVTYYGGIGLTVDPSITELDHTMIVN